MAELTPDRAAEIETNDAGAAAMAIPAIAPAPK